MSIFISIASYQDPLLVSTIFSAYENAENKNDLMQKMGQKLLTIELQEKIESIPDSLKEFNLTIISEGQALCFTYNSQAETTGITTLLQELKNSGLKLKDLKSDQTSLENIFEQLLKESA